MMKMYLNVYNKYRKSKIIKTSWIFKTTLDLSVIYSKCGHEMWSLKIFKEEDSIEVTRILGLITNIEEYQKIYIHA